MQENKDIKEATVEVRKMSEDEKMQRLADLREKAIMDEKAIYAAGLDKGKEQGIEQGIEQGENKRNKEIAEELVKRKMSIEDIAKITTLSIDEIMKIKDKLDDK